MNISQSINLQARCYLSFKPDLDDPAINIAGSISSSFGAVKVKGEIPYPSTLAPEMSSFQARENLGRHSCYVASALGKLLHADKLTDQRISFARICVEASKPLVERFDLDIEKNVFVEINAVLSVEV